MELGKDTYPIWSQLSQVNGVTSRITNVNSLFYDTFWFLLRVLLPSHINAT